MAKHKSPSVLNSRTVRIHIDTYRILRSLSLRDDITMSEALTKLITGAALKEPVSPAQIPLPVTMARSIPVSIMSMPVSIKSMPISIARQRSVPVTISFSREVEVNGHRQAD